MVEAALRVAVEGNMGLPASCVVCVCLRTHHPAVVLSWGLNRLAASLPADRLPGTPRVRSCPGGSGRSVESKGGAQRSIAPQGRHACD